MKNIKIYALFFLIPLLVISCKKEKDATNDDDNTIKSDFIVMSNAYDPLIATTTKDGVEIDFFGQRNNEGIPLIIDNIVVKNSSDTTTYVLDESGRPIKVFSQNGTQFEFNWMSDKKAVLTVISGDGLNQINTEIDFASGVTKATKTFDKSIRADKSVKFEFLNPESSTEKNTTAVGNCIVNVTSCGNATDAPVFVFVKNKYGKSLAMMPTKRVEKGKYTTNIPTNLAPTINAADVCNSFVAALDKACILNQIPGIPMYMCPSLATALAATTIAAPVAAAILTACASVTYGMEIYCSTIAASPAPGLPSLADKICNAEILNRTFTDDIVIFASAIGASYNSNSPSYTVAGGGPFPDLNIESSSETAISTLTINPSSPIADQDYIAECNVFCLYSGTVVGLSIVGSDGYTDSISYEITSNQSEGIFRLTVPGADAGVNDIVTLEITLPDGYILKRTASLVFR